MQKANGRAAWRRLQREIVIMRGPQPEDGAAIVD